MTAIRAAVTGIASTTMLQGSPASWECPFIVKPFLVWRIQPVLQDGEGTFALRLLLAALQKLLALPNHGHRVFQVQRNVARRGIGRAELAEVATEVVNERAMCCCATCFAVESKAPPYLIEGGSGCVGAGTEVVSAWRRALRVTCSCWNWAIASSPIRLERTGIGAGTFTEGCCDGACAAIL